MAAPEPTPHPGPALDADPEPHPLRTTVTGAVDAALDVPAGTTIAVVGPNGAGKTTLLRALLGLTDRAGASPLQVGTQDLTGTPPHRRRIAWVPQDGALFPHLTALANTAYGLRAQGVPAHRARREARIWLDRLAVGGLAHRKPAHLSGGQAQRVALARALAARPPSAPAGRAAGRPGPVHPRARPARAPRPPGRLPRRLPDRHPRPRGSPLPGGRRPRPGRGPHRAVRPARRAHPAPPLPPGWPACWGATPGPARAPPMAPCSSPGERTSSAATPLPRAATAGLAVVAPEAVSLHVGRPAAGSPRNVWEGTVREITAQGARLRVQVDAATDVVAEITPQAATELALAEGAKVWVSVKATEVTFVPL
ncbi:hypothetical protein GCM10020000_27670 [Streptomyces olivoverticillatus]